MIEKQLTADIRHLETNKHLLTKEHLYSLSILVQGEDDMDLFEKFDPSELDNLFALVKTLQRKVVTDTGNLLTNASTRDLSSLIGGITSLLRAFSAQQAKVDEAKELGDLKQAVLAAIESLDNPAAAEIFYETLESYA